MKRCKRCIMPETVPGITFNDDGTCSFCQSYRKEPCLDKSEFETILSSSRQRGARYDCVVALSGGRDSTYVLYLAKAVYGLKVLAVNYDHEFRTDEAAMNMQNVCARLGVDFLSFRSGKGLGHKILKYDLRSSSVEQMKLCRACAYGHTAVPYIAAEQHQVPLILRGESSFESTMNLQQVAYQGFKKSKYTSLLKFDFYRAQYYQIQQRIEFPVSGNSFLSRQSPVLKNKNIKIVRVFDYVPWDRKNIKDTITRELGWEKPKGSATTWRVDCKLHPLINYTFYRMFGCSKDSFGYCKMINGGQMTREEALRQEEELVAGITNNLKKLLEDDIGLTREEARHYLSFPNMWTLPRR